jgi:hypothetical protein
VKRGRNNFRRNEGETFHFRAMMMITISIAQRNVEGEKCKRIVGLSATRAEYSILCPT